MKHIKASAALTSPYIVEWLGRYDCVYKHTIYKSKGGSFSEAFIIWASIVKNECNSILYGAFRLDLLTSVLFPEIVAVSGSVPTLGGMVSYTGD